MRRRNERSQKPTTTKMHLQSFEKDLIVVVFQGSEGPSFIFTFTNNVISFTYLLSKPNHPFLHELNRNFGYINNIRKQALVTKDVYNRSPSLGISFDKPQMLISRLFSSHLGFKAHTYCSFDIYMLIHLSNFTPHCHGNEMKRRRFWQKFCVTKKTQERGLGGGGWEGGHPILIELQNPKFQSIRALFL